MPKPRRSGSRWCRASSPTPATRPRDASLRKLARRGLRGVKLPSWSCDGQRGTVREYPLFAGRLDQGSLHRHRQPTSSAKHRVVERGVPLERNCFIFQRDA
jgi:hypothetical protein